MSVHTLSPRVLPSDHGSVPLVPNGRSPRPLAWLVIAFALLPALLMLTDSGAGFRLVMGALTVTVLTVGIGLHVMFGAIAPRAVRVDDTAPWLWFVPSAAASVPVLLMGVALLLPAIAQLVVDVAGLATATTSWLLSRAPYVLGALGVVIIVTRLTRLRTVAGLEVTSHGVRGIRGHGRVDWSWDDLARVEVIAAPAAKLALTPQGASAPTALAPALALGSDPNLVAVIVRYYLERPAERGVLDEGGVTAIRRVEEAVRERSR